MFIGREKEHFSMWIILVVGMLRLVNAAPSTDGNAVLGGAGLGVSSPREALEAFVKKGAVAGAISMTSDHEKVETAFVGLADPETGRALDEKSFFWIASMTKGFCGAAVMSCVDRGLVSLDDPIEKYIPEIAQVRVAVKEKNGEKTYRPAKVKMTLRMCLSHMAGFPFNPPEYDQDPMACQRLSLADYSALAAKCPLLWDPMTKHSYSNVDINLAGRVVEIVTGQRFEDYLRKTFFEPLEMHDITFFPTAAQQAHRVFVSRVAKGKHYADGRGDRWARSLRPDVIANKRMVSPAGGLYSTAGDVMKFYQMLANDGKTPNGVRLLSHASILELSRAQYPKFDRYSLGLRQYGEWFGHDGALQTEAYANWKENKVALLFVQVTGDWNHPFKRAWRNAVGLGK